MPPSARRRAEPQATSPQFEEPVSDSDEEGEAEDLMEEELEDELLEGAIEVDVEDEEVLDEEEPPGSPLQEDPNLSFPIPPSFREISTLASWTVSSSKPGCSIPQLRSPSTHLFWQSDGPQPHYLNIHFFKLVRIVGMRLFLDFAADESYTPTRMVFLAGSGNNDLVEWGEMRLEQPRGWIWADFSGVGEVDSGESSDDDDEEEGNDGVPPGLTRALDEDEGSDYENAEPTPSGEGAGLGSAGRRGRARLPGRATGNGTGSAMGRAGRAGGGGQITPMNIDLHGTPIQHPTPTPHLPPHQQTPTLPPPSLHRTHPRRALQSLTPNASPQIPPPKEKKHKIPVLRAHLVQIKILENHQNGKDTHLRGLQIFARENEGGRERPREKGLGGKSAGLGDGGKGRRERKSRGGGGMGLDMGTGLGMRGLGRSAWDVEPGIR